jgi:LPXTG-motif cell wall-anchored protein
MKKTLAAITLAGSIAMVGATPALAVTPYPAPSEQGTVSDGTVAPGETFTFSGAGFTPGEAITVTVTLTGAPQALGGGAGGGVSMAVSGKISLPTGTQTFSTTADANGNFALPVTISEAGTYTLTATGQTSGKTVTATVKVSGAAVGTSLANTGNGSGAGLANTGADASLMLWTLVGGGALAAGITSVVVVRRRAKADAAA